MSIKDLRFQCQELRKNNPDPNKLVYMLADLRDVEELLSLVKDEEETNVEENSEPESAEHGEEESQDVFPEQQDILQLPKVRKGHKPPQEDA